VSLAETAALGNPKIVKRLTVAPRASGQALGLLAGRQRSKMVRPRGVEREPAEPPGGMAKRRPQRSHTNQREELPPWSSSSTRSV